MTIRSPAWYAKDARFGDVMAGDPFRDFLRVCPDLPYERGDHLFRQGEPATHLHVIASGQVKLSLATATGHERVIAVVGSGDMIGEAFVLEERVYRVDAIAITQARSCVMSREHLMQLAQESPEFVVRFSSILATNLIRCRESLSHAFDPVKLRIAKVVLDQARRFGEPGDDGRVTLRTGLRHEEIASLASATRVSASMAIAELRDVGLVDGSRGEYRVDVAGLADYIEAEA
jgi:CRP/FNR family transcriptional regulator, cyclic AMP receptor protein